MNASEQELLKLMADSDSSDSEEIALMTRYPPKQAAAATLPLATDDR